MAAKKPSERRSLRESFSDHPTFALLGILGTLVTIVSYFGITPFLSSPGQRLTKTEFIEKYKREERKVQRLIPGARRRLSELPLDEERLLTQFGSGKNLYDSIPGFDDIVSFYADIGTDLRMEVIRIDWVAEITFFPDDFWIEAEPFMDFMRTHWAGKGASCILCRDFYYLRNSLQNRRVPHAHSFPAQL